MLHFFYMIECFHDDGHLQSCICIRFTSQNLEQGQFDVYTSFRRVTAVDGAISLNLCTAKAAGIDTVYLIDRDGSLRPPSVSTSSLATIISDGVQISKFVNATRCTSVTAGCYRYCQDTCFRSVRYEVDPSLSSKLMLKVCRVGHGATCSMFPGALRLNGNDSAGSEPRTFIAHLPILDGYSYKATFVDSTGNRVEVTPLLAQYEEHFCPVSNFAVFLDGRLPATPYTAGRTFPVL